MDGPTFGIVIAGLAVVEEGLIEALMVPVILLVRSVFMADNGGILSIISNLSAASSIGSIGIDLSIGSMGAAISIGSISVAGLEALEPEEGKVEAAGVDNTAVAGQRQS
jgi:hypothetical protein